MSTGTFRHKDFKDTFAQVINETKFFIRFAIMREHYGKFVKLAEHDMTTPDFKTHYPHEHKICLHVNKTEVENGTPYGPMMLTICLDCKQTVNTEKGW